MVDLNHVVNNWYTTAQAAEITGLTRYTVAEYCRNGKFRAVQLPGTGVWYVDPASVGGFRKTRRGRKRGD